MYQPLPTFHEEIHHVWVNFLHFLQTPPGRVMFWYFSVSLVLTIIFKIIRFCDEGAEIVFDHLKEFLFLLAMSLAFSPIIVVFFFPMCGIKFISERRTEIWQWIWGKGMYLYRAGQYENKEKLWKTQDGRMVREDLVMTRIVKDE